MDPSLLRSLADKTYDKRKTSALEVERLVRDSATDLPKLDTIISQLCELSKNPSSNGRSGGIMGLAAASLVLLYRIGVVN